MITVSGPGKTLCFLPVEATAGQGRHSFLLLDKRDVDAAPGWNSTTMFSHPPSPCIQPHTLQVLNRKKTTSTRKDLKDFKGLSILTLRWGGSEKETTLHLGWWSSDLPCPYLSAALPPFWFLPRLTPSSVGISVLNIQTRLNFLHKKNHVNPTYWVLLSSVWNEKIMWPANYFKIPFFYNLLSTNVWFVCPFNRRIYSGQMKKFGVWKNSNTE